MTTRRIVKSGILIIGLVFFLTSMGVVSGELVVSPSNSAVIAPRPAVSNQKDDPLARIRALWAEVQERIALAQKEAESGSPPGFYASEIVVNRHNGSWRASGTYYKKTVFWYTEHPEFAAEKPGGAISVLLKVEIQEIVAARTFYREFLFDKGTLVFAFAQSPDDSGAAAEFRYYFDNGALFRYMEGQKVVAAKPDVKAILAEAKEFQVLFLETF